VVKNLLLENPDMNEVIETIFKRRSIRKYTEQSVEEEKIKLLLQAGMAAPTACNNQPWEFVVVSDPERLAAFRKVLKYGSFKAPLAIVVCDNPKIGKAPDCEQYWVQDLSAAVDSMMIAAVSLGLGTCWIAAYPGEERVESVRQLAGLPLHVTPLMTLYVGYPAETREARTQYEERRVHWQKYQE
jgi:nitroreductase